MYTIVSVLLLRSVKLRLHVPPVNRDFFFVGSANLTGTLRLQIHNLLNLFINSAVLTRGEHSFEFQNNHLEEFPD